MSQEEIRAWRPDFKPGEEQQMTEERRRRMDLDTTNNVFDNADLIQKVLPNTAVTNVILESLPPDFHLTNEPKLAQNVSGLSVEDQQLALATHNSLVSKIREDAVNAWKNEMKRQITELVRNALNVDRSPIVMGYGSNHFVTITGINRAGTKLRIEDSARSNNNATKDMTIDELVDKYLISRPMAEREGVSFTWLQNLPSVDYANRNNGEEHHVPGHFSNVSRINPENGDIVLWEPQNSTMSHFANADAKIGQLKGETMTDTLFGSQNEINMKTRGGKIYHYANETLQMPADKQPLLPLGIMSTYYPKKLYYKNDPNLLANRNQELDAHNAEMKQIIDNDLQNLPQKEVRPENQTFGAYIYDYKQELLKQTADPTFYISRIYAANIVYAQEGLQGDIRTAPQTFEDRQDIDKLAVRVSPMIRAMLNEKDGKIELPLIACRDNPAELLRRVDEYQKRYYNGANPDVDARLARIDDCLDAMDDTHTGHNYFGVARDDNSLKYKQMMRSLRNYRDDLEARKIRGQNPPDGFTNYNTIQSCLNYIDNKMKFRSTKDGQTRFDNTMRTLHELMPAKDFQLLCNKVNRARKIKSTDPEYVTPDTYAPKTVKNLVKKEVEGLNANNMADVKNRFAHILAVRELAKWRNPEHPEKAVVVGARYEKQDLLHLKNLEDQIKRRPQFKRMMEKVNSSVAFYDSLALKNNRLRIYAAKDGEELENEYKNSIVLQVNNKP